MSSVVGWTSLADIEITRQLPHRSEMMGERFGGVRLHRKPENVGGHKWVAVAVPPIHDPIFTRCNESTLGSRVAFATEATSA